VSLSLSPSWIPADVAGRLRAAKSGWVTKDMERVVVHGEEKRTQRGNREAAVNRLLKALREAWPEPKERNIREGISDQGKRRRKEDKRKRGEVKKNRGKVDY